MFDGTVASAGVVVGLITLVPLGFGIGLVGYGIVKGRRARQLEQGGERVHGLVVDNQMESRTQGRITFRPVVRFRTLAGVDITAVTEQPSYRSHVVGTTVPVVYNPASPSRASVVGRSSGATGLIVVGVLVIAFSVCGAAFFLGLSRLVDLVP
jgi:hypothetical protein